MNRILKMGERLLVLVASIYGLGQVITGSWYFGAATLLVVFGFSILLYLARRRESTFELRMQSMLARFSGDKRHREVIRWGRAVSRPLWLSGHYSSRYAIGEMVLQSARTVKDVDSEIRALIDDCGWTLVEMGRWKESEKYLRAGCDLASRCGQLHYHAKALRHLFGNAFRAEDSENARKRLVIAEQATLALPPHNGTRELIAELHYAKSSLAMFNGDYATAEAEIRQAESMYAALPDKEWQLKIAVRVGDIALKRDALDEAMKQYMSALALAEEFNFRRIKVKGHLGLARVHLLRDQLREAHQETRLARKALKDSEMLYERKQLATIETEYGERAKRTPNE